MIPKEIEKKFLVASSWRPLGTSFYIEQGYLSHDENKTIRVRLVNSVEGFLTIKGPGKLERPEFEYEIASTHAEFMLKCMSPWKLSKRRFVIYHEGKKWEVDVFEGLNAPLVMAEIELKTKDEKFSKPPWVRQEVTFDKRYSNINLARNPFSRW